MYRAMAVFEFHLRVDKKALKDYDALVDVLKKRCDSYLLSYEIPVDNPDNEHYQGYIRTLYKEITIRKDLASILSVKGNQAYSLSKLRQTKEKLLQYCCKDGNVLVSTFSEEEVEQFKKEGAETKKEVEKKKKTRADSLFKVLLNYLHEVEPSNGNDMEHAHIALHVLRWFRERNKAIPQVTRLQDIVRALWLARKTDESFERWAKSFVKQFFSEPPENIF